MVERFADILSNLRTHNIYVILKYDILELPVIETWITDQIPPGYNPSLQKWRSHCCLKKPLMNDDITR